MPTRREQLRVPAFADAFGVTFAFHDDLGAPVALGKASSGKGPATTVRHDPSGLGVIWCGANPKRTREVRQEGAMLLSVDQDDSRGYLLTAPGIGSALVDPSGLQVLCAPEAQAREWEALLIGQVLPLAATLRGLEVFHAAGVVHVGRAHLLCGPQGIGKTTLAAHLIIRGAQLLSDDVVALDDRLIAHTGSTVLNVRDVTLRSGLIGSVAGLRRVHTVDGRARFASEHPAEATPLGAIYLLEHARTGAPIERLPQPSAATLLGATFNLSVRTATRLAHHLDLCARLARLIPVYRIRIVPRCPAADLAADLWLHIGSRESVVA